MCRRDGLDWGGGLYFNYAFTTPDFPDYFKVGVFPSGYYVGTNESTYTAYAFDRKLV